MSGTRSWPESPSRPPSWRYSSITPSPIWRNKSPAANFSNLTPSTSWSTWRVATIFLARARPRSSAWSANNSCLPSIIAIVKSDDQTARRWERDGEREREREARGNGKADTAPRFKLKYYKDVLMSTARNYLIKGLLPRRGLAVIWGPPKCGKSFIAFDMGMHIALGRPYRDQRVQQGTVVYLAPEGGGGFPARVEAWRQRFLSADEAAGEIPFWLLNDARIDLIADRAELIKAIRDQVAQPPAAIFVDTLNRSLVGDENASADMGRYVGQLTSSAANSIAWSA